MKDLAIVWFRRDFRLADNPALDYARKQHRQVIPLYIHDPEAEGDWAPGAASRWWLHHALADLARRLESRGSRLLLRHGPSAAALDLLLQQTGATAVYWNRRYEPAAIAQDREIKQSLKDRGAEVRSFRAAVLFEPWELLRDEQPYKVFTPYWNRMQRDWRRAAPAPEPRELSPLPNTLRSEDLDALGLLPGHPWADSLARHWEIGELAARRRLERFIDEDLNRYVDARNRPDRSGTSRLSPDLHFGFLSPVQIVHAIDASGELPGGAGALGFVRELAWREFSTVLLHHFPELTERPMQSRFEHFPWRSAADYMDQLKAWQRGQTGVPLVDAGMRELWASGWMHNRVRMVVASYLTKNLLVPWQQGARWFWDTLVDADLANNTQGWQWTAGCGADAAPFFRIFNPELQAEKFDPDAAYIRRWCPELDGLSHAALKRLDRQARARRGYPQPLVDLKISRQRALDAFARIR